VDADLIFYPSAYPLRALVKARHDSPAPLDEVGSYANVATGIEAFSAALAQNPWLVRFPMALQAVTPILRSGTWIVRDAAGSILPLTRRFQGGWNLLALSGGHALDLFGEWDGDYLLPLSVWTEGRFVEL